LDLAKPNSKDSPAGKRRAELLAELKEIREKQGAGKAGRNKVFDEIRLLRRRSPVVEYPSRMSTKWTVKLPGWRHKSMEG
jgi:hypothetical protein